MVRYEVLLYPKAFHDIEEIYSYLAKEKAEPGIAKGFTDRIWDAVLRPLGAELMTGGGNEFYKKIGYTDQQVILHFHK